MSSTASSKVFPLADLDATERLGAALGCLLPRGSNILLVGDLGTGKTTLVQSIGRGLGITDPIASPTFTLINEYLEGRIPLYHLDLYRLDGVEIEALNLESYWEGVEVEPGIVAIEWADKLTYRPSSYLWVELECQLDDRRAILTCYGGFELPFFAEGNFKL